MKIRLTKEGLYYTGILFCIFFAGIVRGVNLLYIISGMMMGPFLFNWRISRAVIRKVKMKRVFPEMIFAQEPFFLEIHLEGASKYGLEGVVVQNPCDLGEMELEKIQENRPRKKVCVQQLKFRGVVPQRGVFLLEGLKIWTEMPFGLFRAQQKGDPYTLVVFPKRVELPPNWWSGRQEKNERELRLGGRTSHVGEFSGVRDWRSGDTRRMIHWRASAKHQTLVVRQRERVSMIQVYVFADFSPEMDEASFEKAVSVTASVVYDLCRMSDVKWRESEMMRHVMISSLTVHVLAERSFLLQGTPNDFFCREVLTELAQVKKRKQDSSETLSSEESMVSSRGMHTIFISELLK
ncbi:MAG: DUF58 domain-containing protein [Planctomycetia bacterium]|nr:DUF58 domain-containing protein [Planctomycetia bacterium]